LICQGKILEAINLKPSRLNFGQISRKAASQQKTVIVTPGDSGPLKPKLVPVKEQGVNAILREIEPGQRYEIEVTVTPPFDPKGIRAQLMLETGVERAPTATIPVYASVLPRVAAQPKRITVPANRQTDWKQIVRLVWDDDTPHKILSATADDPGMKVQLKENGGSQEVVLEVPGDYEPQPGAHAVTIKTDDSEAPVVSVPVSMRSYARSPRGKPVQPSSPAKQTVKSSKVQTRAVKEKTAKPETPKPPAKPSD
jgi:hypothetical protein